MKLSRIICAIFFSFIPVTLVSQSKPIDHTTLTNGKKLHFQIVEGRRDDIILFESGGGDSFFELEVLLLAIDQKHFLRKAGGRGDLVRHEHDRNTALLGERRSRVTQ